MIFIKTLVTAVLFCSLTAVADDFSVSLQAANWETKKAESSCQLKQNIPLYGTADFTHQTGGLLRFSIREDRFKPDIVKASLAINTPSWVHAPLEAKDYLVYLEAAADIQNIPRLSVYGKTAEVMLDALSNGMSPTFSYIRASVAGLLPETKVAVSSINFSKSYQQFVECRKNFLPSGIKNVLEKSLFFKSRSQVLNAGSLAQLQNTAKYIKQVKGSRVVIVSDTAISGKRDKNWFSNRAKMIVAKLKSFGVPKNKVSIKNGLYTASTNHKNIRLGVFGPETLRAFYYRKGSIKLSQSEKRRLSLMARYAKAFMPNSRLVIKSYTDSKGKRVKNLAVSKKRGAEVKRYLVAQGIGKDKVIVKAYGESRPAKSNRFPKGRAQNRRVIIDFMA
jgi:outer membrane protein OmpA-like peptidoglycan-associated protein